MLKGYQTMRVSDLVNQVFAETADCTNTHLAYINSQNLLKIYRNIKWNYKAFVELSQFNTGNLGCDAMKIIESQP